MEREQFTFYVSFARAAKRIRKAADRCAFYDAIVDYALREEMPDMDTLPDSAAMGFEIVKPILDSGRKKAKNGKKGGTAKAKAEQGEGESKPEADGKQSESKPEADEEQGEDESKNKNKIKDKNKDKIKDKIKDKCLLTPHTPLQRDEMIREALAEHGEDLIEQVRSWMQYKTEKRQPYQDTGFKSMLTQIRKGADEYGDAAMIDVIRESMSSNYQGIMFDRLGRHRKPPQNRNVKAECKPQPVPDPDRLWELVNAI